MPSPVNRNTSDSNALVLGFGALEETTAQHPSDGSLQSLRADEASSWKSVLGDEALVSSAEWLRSMDRQGLHPNARTQVNLGSSTSRRRTCCPHSSKRQWASLDL